MIRPPITLAPAIARCPSSRAKPCNQSHACARALVAADKGRPVHDYSTERSQWMGCPGYLPAESFRDVQKAGPTVHDAPEGLR